MGAVDKISKYIYVTLCDGDDGIKMSAIGIGTAMQAAVKAVLFRGENLGKHPLEVIDNCDEQIRVTYYFGDSISPYHFDKGEVRAEVLKEFEVNERNRVDRNQMLVSLKTPPDEHIHAGDVFGAGDKQREDGMSDYYNVRLNAGDKGIMVAASGVGSTGEAITHAISLRAETDGKRPDEVLESCDEWIDVEYHYCGEVYPHRWSRDSIRRYGLKEPLGKESAQDLIAAKCDQVKNLLLQKNADYGNSALDPLRIFSKADPEEQIRVRIDDKLSRLAGAGEKNFTEDTVMDLIGYLILLAVKMEEGE